MIKVIGVRFRTAGKIYFFDPLEFEVKRGDHVIVETARGVEYGTVVCDPKEVEEDQVIQPLKPVLRVATGKDDEQEKNNKEKENEKRYGEKRRSREEETHQEETTGLARATVCSGWFGLRTQGHCIQHVFIIFLHFKWVSLVAQMVKNLPAMRETWVRSLGWKDPLEESMATHSSILA